MELREKIAAAIFELEGYPPLITEWSLEVADTILAIPEIAEALSQWQRAENYRDYMNMVTAKRPDV